MKYLQRGYGLDVDGYIMSDVSKDKISIKYKGCIRESAERLSESFPDDLHSIYLYGSVARGDGSL